MCGQQQCVIEKVSFLSFSAIFIETVVSSWIRSQVIKYSISVNFSTE